MSSNGAKKFEQKSNSSDLFFTPKQSIMASKKYIGEDLAYADWIKCSSILEACEGITGVDVATSSDAEVQKNEMVMTKTTVENLNIIKQAAIVGTPLLLQGGAGVGKSATVAEAAKQCGNLKPLIRFNLSSRITIDDLIGKMTLFQPDGHWLLLDELNLTPDNVLQAIESAAIGTKELILPECAVGKGNKTRTIPMHKDFRIFATQNPNSGFFKGTREKLSTSFLDRFSPINFKELPINEWVDIMTDTLVKRGWKEGEMSVSAKANFLVEAHFALTKVLRDRSFPEKAGYADVSIRELLRVIDRLVEAHLNYPSSISGNLFPAKVADEIWSVYGSRFRGLGREAVLAVFKKLPTPTLNINTWNVDSKKVQLFDLVTLAKANDSGLRYAYPENVNPEWIISASNIDKIILDTIYSMDFLKSHGVYINAPVWLKSWMSCTSTCSSESSFIERGAGCDIFIENAAYSTTLDPNEDRLLPERPYAITPRVLTTWKQMAMNCTGSNSLRPESILIVGKDGCGKSDCVRAFASILARHLSELCMMPETEPSALIGQFTPNERVVSADEPRVKWLDGVVTGSYLSGSWVLLDNLSQAEPSVLERLNPVLEQPPELVLIEKGESNPAVMIQGFKVFATMTPPVAGGGDAQGAELSPALANRFTTVYMEDIVPKNKEVNNSSTKQDFLNELKILWVVYTEWEEWAEEVIAEICWEVCTCGYLSVTLRILCRFMDFAYCMSLRAPNLSPVDAIWTAFTMTIEAQIPPRRRNDANTLISTVELILSRKSNLTSFSVPDFNSLYRESMENNGRSEHVLTSSRAAYAQMILACVSSRMSVLLEGGAATGKTSLVAHLAKRFRVNTPTGNRAVRLERVNNTDSTTIQDYLGSYLPAGNCFVFKTGPLYRAMLNGDWFLSDEFNLADPSVMNLLFSILEGVTDFQIPGTNKSIPINPNFRFFATQNASGYATNRHKLPNSLRSRFVELQFDDFPVEDLASIIRNRVDDSVLHQFVNNGQLFTDSDSSVPERIAGLYHRLLKQGVPNQITMREIVKWTRRKAVFPSISWGVLGFNFLSSRLSASQISECAMLGEAFVEEKLLSKSDAEDLIRRWQGDVAAASFDVNGAGNGVVFKEGELEVELSNMHVVVSAASLPDCIVRRLVRIAVAVKLHEPVILIGDSSYKSFTLSLWSKMQGSDNSSELDNYPIQVNLNSETESSDLLGEIKPYSVADILAHFSSLSVSLSKRIKNLYNAATSKGYWDSQSLYVKNVNYFGKEVPELMEGVVNEWRERSGKITKLKSASPEVDNPNINDLEIAFNSIMSPVLIDSSIEFQTLMEENRNNLQIDEFDGGYQPNVFGQSNGEMNSPPPFAYITTHAFNSSLIEDSPTSTSTSDVDEIEEENLFMVDFADVEQNSAVDNLSREENPFAGGEIENNSDLKNLLGDISSNGEENIFAIDVNEVSVDFKDSNDGDEYEENPFFTEQDLLDCNANDDMIEQIKYLQKTDASFAKAMSGEALFSLPESFINGVLLDHLKSARDITRTYANRIWNGEDDSTTEILIAKMYSLINVISERRQGDGLPAFLFQDGPVSKAAKLGVPIYLEDFDQPSAAVTERLNSLLETTPSFSLSEDITISKSVEFDESSQLQLRCEDTSIWISPTFQVFATVHVQKGQSVNQLLSPATRSRFTMIYCTTYDNDELKKIVRRSLIQDLDTAQAELIQNEHIDNPSGVVTNIFILREEFQKKAQFKNDIHRIFRMVDFIKYHSTSITLIDRAVLAIRFFYGDELESVKQLEAIQGYLDRIPASLKNAASNYEYYFKDPTENDLILSSKDANTPPSISLIGGFDAKKVFEKSRIAPTKTMIANLCRIFAAVTAKAPLLLIGPPGIGKTAGVELACSVIGSKYERINLSGNTTFDSLIGAIVPTVENNVRVFKYQPGILVRALEQGKWILFDEINLAPSEVLDCIAPLLARMEYFKVPLTGERIPLENIRVFATMNPASIGGGRSKLPRSIKNLFTSLILDDMLDEILLQKLFDIHKDVKSAVTKRDIGKKGGPFEFNLRTLLQLRELIAENFKDREFFSKSSLGNNPAAGLTSGNNKVSDRIQPSSNKLTLKILSCLTDMVYASCFQNIEEQARVQTIIQSHMGIAATALDEKVSIDSSAVHFTRVGAVYLKKGKYYNDNAEDYNMQRLSPLSQTSSMCQQMQVIASATQSRRPVLLEGDTCSGKTALIRELARLSNQELVLIPLNQDIETSELIGQWLQIKSNSAFLPNLRFVEKIFRDSYRHLLVFVSPMLHQLLTQDPDSFVSFTDGSEDESVELVFSNIFNEVRIVMEIQKGLHMDGKDLLRQSDEGWKLICQLSALQRLMKLFKRCNSLSFASGEIALNGSNLMSRMTDLVEKLQSLESDYRSRLLLGSSSSNNSFQFVTTPRIEAMKNGQWVLFDNFNSAPPEVMERLNSLFEENPFLSLYEKAEGEILDRKNIHINFRIFATSNINRTNSNKISPAMLNRCIRIWLPPLDTGLRSDVGDAEFPATEKEADFAENHSLFKIIQNKLSGVSGTSELAIVSLLFHRRTKMCIAKREVSLMSGFQLTARVLLRSIDTIVQQCDVSQKSPLLITIWSLLRGYGAIMERPEDTKRLIQILKELVQYFSSTKKILYQRYITLDHHTEFWYSQTTLDLFPLITNIEIQFTNLLLLVLSNEYKWRNSKLITMFIENVLIPIITLYSNASFNEVLSQSTKSSSNCQASDLKAIMKLVQDTVRNAVQLRRIGLLQNFTDDMESSKYQTLVSSCVNNLKENLTSMKFQIKLSVGEVSVLDVAGRVSIISRILSLCDTFKTVLSHESLSRFVKQYPLMGELQSVLQSSAMIAWLSQMDDSVSPTLHEFNTAVSECRSRGAVWAYQHEATNPIISNQLSLRNFATELISEGVTPYFVKRFQLAAEWSSLILECRMLGFSYTSDAQSYQFSSVSIFSIEVRETIGHVLNKLRTIRVQVRKELSDFVNENCRNDTRDLETKIDVQKQDSAKMQIKVSELRAELDSYIQQVSLVIPKSLSSDKDDSIAPTQLIRIKSSSSDQLAEELIRKVRSKMGEYNNLTNNEFLIKDFVEKSLQPLFTESSNALDAIQSLVDSSNNIIRELENSYTNNIMLNKRYEESLSQLLTSCYESVEKLNNSTELHLLKISLVRFAIVSHKKYIDALNNAEQDYLNHIPDELMTVAESISRLENYFRQVAGMDPPEKILQILQNDISFLWITIFIARGFITNSKKFRFYLFSTLDSSIEILNIVKDSLNSFNITNSSTYADKIFVFVYDATALDPISCIVIDTERTLTQLLDMNAVLTIDSGWKLSVSVFHTSHARNTPHDIFYAQVLEKLEESFTILQTIPISNMVLSNVQSDEPVNQFIVVALSSILFPFNQYITTDITEHNLTFDESKLVDIVYVTKSDLMRSAMESITFDEKEGESNDASQSRDFLMDNSIELIRLVTEVISSFDKINVILHPSIERNFQDAKDILNLIDNSLTRIELDIAQNNSLVELFKNQLFEQAAESFSNQVNLYSLLFMLQQTQGWSVIPNLIHRCVSLHKDSSNVDKLSGQLQLFQEFQTAQTAVSVVIRFIGSWVIKRIEDVQQCDKIWSIEKEMFSFANDLINNVLKNTVSLADKEINLIFSRSNEWFQDMQLLLNKYLAQLNVTKSVIQSNSLETIFDNLAIVSGDQRIGDSSTDSKSKFIPVPISLSVNVQELKDLYRTWHKAELEFENLKELLSQIVDDDTTIVASILACSQQLSAYFSIISESVAMEWESKSVHQTLENILQNNRAADEPFNNSEKESISQLIATLDSQVYPIIFASYAAYRESLLLDTQNFSLISNFNRVRLECTLASNWMQERNPSLLNIFPLIKILHGRSQAILQELRSCIVGTTSILTPIMVECEDLIALFIPKNLTAVKCIKNICGSYMKYLHEDRTSKQFEPWKPRFEVFKTILSNNEDFPVKSPLSIFSSNSIFRDNLLTQIVNVFYEMIFGVLKLQVSKEPGFKVASTWNSINDCLPLQITLSLSMLSVSSFCLKSILEENIKVRLSDLTNSMIENSFASQISGKKKDLDDIKSKQMKLEKKRADTYSSLANLKERSNYEEEEIIRKYIEQNKERPHQAGQKTKHEIAKCETQLVKFDQDLNDLELEASKLQQGIELISNDKDTLRVNRSVQVKDKMFNNFKLLIRIYIGVLKMMVNQVMGCQLDESNFSALNNDMFTGHSATDDNSDQTSSTIVQDTNSITPNYMSLSNDIGLIHSIFMKLLESCSSEDIAHIEFHPTELERLQEEWRNISSSWFVSVVGCSLNSLSNACKHWPDYQIFFGKYRISSSLSTGLSNIIHQLRKYSSSFLQLLFSLINEGYRSDATAAKESIDKLIGATNSLHNLSKSVGAISSCMLKSFNMTIAFIISTVIAVIRYLKLESPLLASDFNREEESLKSILIKQNNLTKSLHASLQGVDIDYVWTVPLEENALKERIDQLRLFVPSIATSLCQFITHSCFDYLCNPFSLLEDIQFIVKEYIDTNLAAGYASYQLFESLKAISRAFITNVSDIAIDNTSNLIVDDTSVLEMSDILFDDKHKHPSIFVRCSNSSCNYVVHYGSCTKRSNLVKPGTSKREIKSLQIMILSFAKLASRSLLLNSKNNGPSGPNVMNMKLFLSSAYAQLCDELVVSCSDFYSIVSHRRSRMEKYCKQLDNNVILMTKELLMAALNSAPKEWSNITSQLRPRFRITQSYHLLIELPNSDPTILMVDEKSVLLSDMYHLDELRQLINEEIMSRQFISSKQSFDMFFDRFQLIATLITDAVRDMKHTCPIILTLNYNKLRDCNESGNWTELNKLSLEAGSIKMRFDGAVAAFIESRAQARLWEFNTYLNALRENWDEWITRSIERKRLNEQQTIEYNANIEKIHELVPKYVLSIVQLAKNEKPFKDQLDKLQSTIQNINIEHRKHLPNINYEKNGFYSIAGGLALHIKYGLKGVDITNLQSYAIELRVEAGTIDNLYNRLFGGGTTKTFFYTGTGQGFNCALPTLEPHAILNYKLKKGKGLMMSNEDISEEYYLPLIDIMEKGENTIETEHDNFKIKFTFSRLRGASRTHMWAKDRMSNVELLDSIYADYPTLDNIRNELEKTIRALRIPDKVSHSPQPKNPQDVTFSGVPKRRKDENDAKKLSSRLFLHCVEEELLTLNTVAYNAKKDFSKLEKKFLRDGMESFFELLASVLKKFGSKQSFAIFDSSFGKIERSIIKSASWKPLVKEDNYSSDDISSVCSREIKKVYEMAHLNLSLKSLHNSLEKVYMLFLNTFVLLLSIGAVSIETIEEFSLFIGPAHRQQIISNVMSHLSVDNFDFKILLTRYFTSLLDSIIDKKSSMLNRITNARNLATKCILSHQNDVKMPDQIMSSINLSTKNIVFTSSSSDGSIFNIAPLELLVDFGAVPATMADKGSVYLFKNIQFLNQTEKVFSIDVTDIVVTDLTNSENDASYVITFDGNSTKIFVYPASSLTNSQLRIKLATSQAGAFQELNININKTSIEFESVVCHPKLRHECELCSSKTKVVESLVLTNNTDISLCVKGGIHSYFKNGESSSKIDTQFKIDSKPIFLEGRRSCCVSVTCIPGEIEGDEEIIEATLVLGMGHSPSDVVVRKLPISVTIKKPIFFVSCPSSFGAEFMDIKNNGSLPALEAELDHAAFYSLTFTNNGEVPLKIHFWSDYVKISPSKAVIGSKSMLNKSEHVISYISNVAMKTKCTVEMHVSGYAKPIIFYVQLKWGRCVYSCEPQILEFHVNATSVNVSDMVEPIRPLSLYNNGDVVINAVVKSDNGPLLIEDSIVIPAGGIKRVLPIRLPLKNAIPRANSSFELFINGRVEKRDYKVVVKKHNLDISPSAGINAGKCRVDSNGKFTFVLTNQTDRKFGLGPLSIQMIKESSRDIINIVKTYEVIADYNSFKQSVTDTNSDIKSLQLMEGKAKITLYIGFGSFPGPFRCGIYLRLMNEPIVHADGNVENRLIWLSVYGTTYREEDTEGKPHAFGLQSEVKQENQIQSVKASENTETNASDEIQNFASADLDNHATAFPFSDDISNESWRKILFSSSSLEDHFSLSNSILLVFETLLLMNGQPNQIRNGLFYVNGEFDVFHSLHSIQPIYLANQLTEDELRRICDQIQEMYGLAESALVKNLHTYLQ
eukprot:gene4737-6644_t